MLGEHIAVAAAKPPISGVSIYGLYGHPLPALKPNQGARPKVLVVMPLRGCPGLLEGLGALGVETQQVHTCNQARRLLERCPEIRTVVTGQTLPDGTWRAVVEAVAANGVNAEVVVVGSNTEAGLRRQVRESAAYGLLLEPSSPGDIRRVVGGAVLTSYRRYMGISEQPWS